MGLFSSRYSWNFPSNNFGQISGIADSGVETFNGTPIKSLAREICQNSIDANLDRSEPTYVEFVTYQVSPSDIPDIESLTDSFKRAQEFWSIQNSSKAVKFFKAALQQAKSPRITCLRISDSNTTGLVGSGKEYNSPWSNLIKSQGASDKSGSNGGSFGIGKFAPYACSNFRTVFYSTVDSEGVTAHQGVARLTSFRNRKSEITQGTGFYGGEKNSPVKSQLSLDPNYNRNKDNSGTDIFILGFNGGKGWENEMIASILDGFLYAVYADELVVKVEDIVINRDNLPTLIAGYKDYFTEYADEYFTALSSDERKSPVYEKEIGDYGRVSLRLMIQPDFHRRVAMVRKTGMKIMDKGNINGLIPFAGVLYIRGDKLNEFLRNLENPQHTKWEIDRSANKAEAKRVLSSLTQFIKACLNELKNDDSEEALDPSVGEYLGEEQTPYEAGSINNGEDLRNTISTVEVQLVKHKPKEDPMEDFSIDNGDKPDGAEPSPDQMNEDGETVRSENDDSTHEDTSEIDSGLDNEVTEHKSTLMPIQAIRTRVTCMNKQGGNYRVVFVPKESAKDGILSFYLSAESQNYAAPLISAECSEGEMHIFSNQVTNLAFVENQPVCLSVKIDYPDYCSMEVKASGYTV